MPTDLPQRPQAAPSRGAFVVGVPRSGTTLLKSLLDGHPRVLVAPGETFAVDWCGDGDPVTAFFAQTSYGERFPKDTPERTRLEAELRARLPGPGSVGTAVRAVMDALATLREGDAPEVWVEKTPKHLRVVPELLEVLGPSTRVIGMLRDPRAVFASHLARWNKVSGRALRRFVRNWVICDVLFRRFEARPGMFLALRYEDLVREPEASTRRVCEHLGVAWQPSLLTPTQAGETWVGPAGQTRVSEDSLERWRERLDPARRTLIEDLLGPRMVRRGYPVDVTRGVSAGLRRAVVECDAALRRLLDPRGTRAPARSDRRDFRTATGSAS